VAVQIEAVVVEGTRVVVVTGTWSVLTEEEEVVPGTEGTVVVSGTEGTEVVVSGTVGTEVVVSGTEGTEVVVSAGTEVVPGTTEVVTAGTVALLLLLPPLLGGS
jgi:phosphosulfolactate phosphohydrolase-like enzyme